MKKYPKKVLNAISRSQTARVNELAIKELEESYAIDFKTWCEVIDWKASASTLLNSLKRKQSATMKKLEKYNEEVARGDKQ